MSKAQGFGIESEWMHMELLIKTEPATLQIDGTCFHVTAFEGIEAINAPFRVEVSFFSKDKIQLTACPTWATLSMSAIDNATKEWHGQISEFSSTEIDDFTYQYKVVIKHPLHQLSFYQQAQQFFDDNELSLAVEILNKHQIEFELLGIRPEQIEAKPLIQQFSHQNDLDFFNQLLAQIHVQYAIQPSNKISLFFNSKLLPKSSVECLHYLPKQKQWHDGVPHFYDYYLQVQKNQPAQTTIKSGLSHLRAGEQLCLSLNVYEKNKPWYVIKQVQHRYELDAAGYENTALLFAAELLPAPDEKQPALATHLSKGKIKSTYSHANLDGNGQYQYELEDTLTPKQPQSQQPYAPRLTPLAGKVKMGLHFPLQNSDEIFMAYTNAQSQSPIILANTSSPYQSAYASFKYKEQCVMAVSDDLALRLDDSKDNECIQFNARHNVCLWTNAVDNPCIHFASPHTITLQAIKDISCQSNSSELIGHDTATLQTKQNIEHHIEQNYYEQVNETASLQAKNYQSKSQHHLQLQCENLTLDIEKNLSLMSEEGNLKLFSADTININASIISIDSDNDFEIGTASAFIQKKQNQLHVRAEKLRMSDNDSIHYVGEIHQQSAGANVQVQPPFLSATLYPHKSIEQKTAQQIENLSWQNCAPQIDKPAIATFTADGYKKGDRGFVIVYQCTATNEALINQAALAEKSNNETYQEIARIKFKIYEEENNHVNVSWQPKSLPENKTEKLIYYRFAVEMKGEAEPALSKAMQWFSCIELKHKGKASVAGFKIERRILPNLRYFEPSENEADTIDLVVPHESTQAFKDNIAFIAHVPLNVSNKIYLLAEDQKIKEVISQDFKSVGPYQTCKLTTLKTNLSHEIYSLKEPIIINLNTVEFDKKTNTPIIHQKQDENSRLLLTENELNYFKENGNNVTIFIHGFNVPYGQFGHHITNVKKIKQKKISASTGYATEFTSGYIAEKYDTLCTIKKSFSVDELDENQLDVLDISMVDQKQKNEIIKQAKTKQMLNDDMRPSDMHSWVTEFEDNLNTAAGFKNDYREFSRALFIAWPGEPKSPADYMEANAKSKKMGRAFAEVLLQLRKFSQDIEINIIAHSQGNGVMLSALDYIGELDNTVMVDHVFAWQAAIPYTALNGVQGMTKQPAQYFDGHVQRRIAYCRKVDPWFLPFAHLASKKFTILYSQNDNIVGPVIEQESQPGSVNEKTVFMRKPIAEHFAGIFTTYLGLGSLYEAANQLGFPASILFEESSLSEIWQKWVNLHPTGQVRVTDPSNGNGQYKPLHNSLEKQMKEFENGDALKEFCQEISKRLQNKKALLDEKVSWAAEKAGSLKEKAIMYGGSNVLKHADSLEQYFIGSKYREEQIFKNKNLDDDITLHEILTNILYLLFAKDRMSWLTKLCTFLYCIEINSNQAPIHGMGWFGADLNNEPIRKLFRNKNLANINCTPWVWEHSDMKVPSEDIMEKIYKEQIIDKIHYGKYVGAGKNAYK